MTTNALINALQAIDAGKLALSLGDSVAAARHFESAAILAQPNLSSEADETLELARFEALRLWGHTLTPWEQANHLTEVILEASDSRTQAGTQMMFALHFDQAEAWGQVGGWKDALACYELAYLDAVADKNSDAMARATTRITQTKKNL